MSSWEVPGGAEAAEAALEAEIEAAGVPTMQMAREALSVAESLRDDHPQRVLLLTYSKTLVRCIEIGDDEGAKMHGMLIQRHFPRLTEQATQAGRAKGRKATNRARKQSAHERHAEIRKLFDASNLPRRDRAAAIGRKLGISASTVRRALKK